MASANLPEDIIQEILVRLPIKSILRFKSTSKQHYSLIRSRLFIDFHRRNQLLDAEDSRHYLLHSPCSTCLVSSAMFFSPNALISELNRLFNTSNGDFSHEEYVLGPLNNDGVCCVAITSLGNCGAAFFNPATREINLLPFLEVEPEKRARDDVWEKPYYYDDEGSSGNQSTSTIAQDTGYFNYHSHTLPRVKWSKQDTERFYEGLQQFGSDLSMINHFFPDRTLQQIKSKYNKEEIQQPMNYYGFCCIKKNRDYKMVVVTQTYTRRFLAYVYSLRRGSWALVCDSNDSKGSYGKATRGFVDKKNGQIKYPTLTRKVGFVPQCLVNECVHWMVKDSILQFDMVNEVFGLIVGPPDEYTNVGNVRLVKKGVSGIHDRLGVVIIVCDRNPNDWDNQQVDVWIMKEYGVEESWTKMYSCKVCFDRFVMRFLGASFSVTTGEDDVMSIERVFFLDHKRNCLMVCYDSGLVVRSDVGSFWDWKAIGIATYVETLEPLAKLLFEKTSL